MITVTEIESTITLSNFRVVYHAPRYEDGRVLYDPYCAILADSAEHDGATVRVFDVPDVDEGQLAAALFACDAMNQHEQYVKLLEAAQSALQALRDVRRSGCGLRFPLTEQMLKNALATTTSK